MGALTDVVTTRRDDAGGDGATRPKVFNGDHPVANPGDVGITELNVGDPNSLAPISHGDIGLLIAPTFRRISRSSCKMT